jgi:hypothetical protein
MSSLRPEAGDERTPDGSDNTAIRIDTSVFASLSADENAETEPKISRWLGCWQG